MLSWVSSVARAALGGPPFGTDLDPIGTTGQARDTVQTPPPEALILVQDHQDIPTSCDAAVDPFPRKLRSRLDIAFAYGTFPPEGRNALPNEVLMLKRNLEGPQALRPSA